MYNKKIPYRPDEIQNGLSFFLPLDATEEVLKAIWQEHPEYHSMDDVDVDDFFSLIKTQVADMLDVVPDHATALTAREFIPYGYNIAVYKHLRYFPGAVHEHDFFEMTFIVKGDCEYTLPGQTLHMEEGDLVIIPPGIKHSIAMAGEETLFFNVLIRTGAFDSSFLKVLDEKDVLTYFFRQVFYSAKNDMFVLFKTGTDRQMTEHMFVLYSEYLRGFRYSNRMLETILTGYFVLLLRYHDKDAVVINDTRNERNADIILIMNYIQNQFATANLESTAAFFNYSARQMGRIVKKYTGMTFSELLQSLKLQMAEKLLLTQEKSVTEICREVGYEDTTHFYNLFKRKYGCTPGEYRRRF